MKIAAIDIGSNSVKLLVAKYTKAGKIQSLHQEKVPLQLGHETLQTHLLSSIAISRLEHTLMHFDGIARSFGTKHIAAVATAALREAQNRNEVLGRIVQKTGIHINVLKGEEEARLIGLAAANATSERYPSCLNIDIGGGSTEFSLIEHNRPTVLKSIDLGAVRLTEGYLFSDPPRPSEVSTLRDAIEHGLRPAMKALTGHMPLWYTGTSGTILAIQAAMDVSATLKATGKKSKHERIISSADLALFVRKIAQMSCAERCKLRRVSKSRARTIVAGAIILSVTMSALKIQSLEACTFGLRDGLVLAAINAEY